ncbi:MAG TPA: Hsp20/alpha crystallin family protein [Pyrinomonadaceae bacterium]|nr:Hsp20/alpha crystallin family protein [Pyrinomonadaceae bacterium]
MKGNLMAPVKDLMSLDPFHLFPNRTERLLEESLLRAELPLKAWIPPCDIFETDTELVMKFELPEVKKEDVEVKLEQNVLTLRGERKFEDRENYHRVERHYGEFVRSFSVPMFVDAARITAEFKDGVLTVTLPKNEEARPKQINVKVN